MLKPNSYVFYGSSIHSIFDHYLDEGDKVPCFLSILDLWIISSLVQLYPISWLISNNEYGNIVKHGFKMYGKTASLFLYAWDTMAGLSQEVLFGGFGFAGTSVPH